MTTINTTITTVGETQDGHNYDNDKEYNVTIYKHEHHEGVVAEWNGDVYTMEDIRDLLVDMEHVDKRTS